ncbi:MAG: coproporphyrinogen III oxidase, partial [Candidatus Nanopelagicales bacterium]
LVLLFLYIGYMSLHAAIELQPEHISAYALIVEDGTRLSRQIRDGEAARPDDDEQAEKYELADQTLKSAGFEWYEISNWSRDAQTRCRHNLGYWSGSNWWGIGPGAHSHIGGVRWWNVKHPRAYASRMAAEESPAAGREVLDESTQWVEQVMLGIRCRDGVPRELLTVEAEQAAQLLVADELLTRSDWESGRAVLTERGRLLADLVVRTITA